MTRIKAVLLGDAGSGVVTAGPTLGLSVMLSHLWDASEFPKFGAARKGAQVMSSGEFAHGEDIASGHPFALDEADLVGFLGLDTLTQENIFKTPEHAVIVRGTGGAGGRRGRLWQRRRRGACTWRTVRFVCVRSPIPIECFVLISPHREVGGGGLSY